MTYNDVLASINTNLASGTQITAALHRVVEQALLDFAESQWLPGDIKEIDCTDAYIAANFDSNGIGINERLGWAICNGYNGWTRNRTGRVSVAYGITPLGAAGLASAQPSVGAALNTPVIGGQKDAVVVAHTHTLKANVNKTNNVPAGGGTPNDDTKQLLANDSDSISTTGVPGTDKNMQPYIVTLFIQKL
jgi:hypothetical protein